MKVQFIRGVFVIFRLTGNKENLMFLVKKLLKLSKISDSKTEKEKTAKPHGKECNNMEVMEEEGKKKEVVDLNLPQEGKEVKETNAGKEKDNCSKELESTMYFNLFCEGALNLVDILIKESFDKEIEEKYEKATLEFKNKIKRRAGEEKNSYFDKI